MKCEKCGEEINSVLLDVFQYDGSDRDETFPINYCEENAVYVDTTQNWTGYELSEDEMRETLVCPHCKQFPFSDPEIQVYNIVRVVCFRQEATNEP